MKKKKKEPEIVMVDGIPCIVAEVEKPPPRVIIRFFPFSELQKNKEDNYLEKVLKDLEKMFKDWDFSDAY